MMLGDFNARVGVFHPADGLWHGTIGRHEIAERNHAGEEFLQFCESYQLMVMNTYFQKSQYIYTVGSWMHLQTKRCHMIDFVVMRTSQRKYCLDVQIMRKANCWTDSILVTVRVRVMVPQTTVAAKR